MDPKRGDLSLLDHPVARELLQAAIPARLAYLALDATPRLVPVQFHWTGDEVVVHSFPDDPKVAAIRAHPQVALSLDTNEPPYRVLQIRGAASVTIFDAPSAEMATASIRYMGPTAGRAWIEQSARISPQQARIAVRPAWVDVLDFATRLPAGMARRMATPSHSSGAITSTVSADGTTGTNSKSARSPQRATHS